jgi:competence protein ComEA
VNQSPPPWRVFEAPGSTAAAGAGVKPTEGAPRLAGANPVVALAGVAGALVIGGLAVMIALSGSGGGTVVGPSNGLGAFEPVDTAGAGGLVVVDVAGAVVTPGVFRLPAASRVGDAIQAAGGFSPRVDADRVAAELNLAATLQDGAQIRVPSRDETPPPGGGAGGSGAGLGSGGGLINVNTASQSQLEELPGIGPVTAQKILASRATAPFATIDELRERGLVGEATFEDIRALVTIG